MEKEMYRKLVYILYYVWRGNARRPLFEDCEQSSIWVDSGSSSKHDQSFLCLHTHCLTRQSLDMSENGGVAERASEASGWTNEFG